MHDKGKQSARLQRAIVAASIGCAAAAGALVPDIALAQAWPAKPVRFILGFPPGGGSDILGRIVAARIQEQMGQSVLIENRPGASGNIAAELVAKSAADGYTIYLAQIAAVAISPSLFPKLGYDPLRDFAPISLIATGPNVLVVH
ncbi:MAG: Bug family tripartite tricarboxylate transporter substrate binding protein, partial [bacterium]